MRPTFARRRSPAFLPEMESLEDRCLLSGTDTVAPLLPVPVTAPVADVSVQVIADVSVQAKGLATKADLTDSQDGDPGAVSAAAPLPSPGASVTVAADVNLDLGNSDRSGEDSGGDKSDSGQPKTLTTTKALLTPSAPVADDAHVHTPEKEETSVEVYVGKTEVQLHSCPTTSPDAVDQLIHAAANLQASPGAGPVPSTAALVSIVVESRRVDLPTYLQEVTPAKRDMILQLIDRVDHLMGVELEALAPTRPSSSQDVAAARVERPPTPERHAALPVTEAVTPETNAATPLTRATARDTALLSSNLPVDVSTPLTVSDETPVRVQAFEGLVAAPTLLLGQASEMVAGFAPFDPSQVEEAVGRLVGQLDQVRSDLGRWFSIRGDLLPWLTTTAAFLAGAEVARRQWQARAAKEREAATVQLPYLAGTSPGP
jgi:hypothetical protein